MKATKRLKAALPAAVLAAVLLAGCPLPRGGTRRVFYFPAIGTEKIVREVRRLPDAPVQGALRLCIDELLLGPETPRLRPLFTRGTTVEFLALEGGTLYVGLSGDVIQNGSDSPDIDVGIALFERNIRKNFREIEKIELFIGGKSVYKD